MESLALVVTVILFTALVGGPTALLLTYVPDKPKSVRILRTIFILILAAVSILFGIQLVLGSAIPAFPRLIGFSAVLTSVLALLYEFKILKHKHLQAAGNSADSFNPISTGLDSSEAKTYAVIFSSKRQDANSELYYQHNDELEEHIKTIPGYLKNHGLRHPETRQGITIAYFSSLEGIEQWRNDSQHMDAKKLAKSHFYENYNLEITEVIDTYGWPGN